MDRKYKKPAAKADAPTKAQTPVSPLLSPIQMSGTEIYGVNALQLLSGATADYAQLSAFDIPLSTSAVLNTVSDLNPLLEAPIEELIDAYATARGYSTSVTYAKVSQYVSDSLNALSILMHMFRAQNVTQVKSDSGIDVGTVLGSRPSTTITDLGVCNYVINGVVPSINAVNDGAVAISNASWSRDWLSHLVHFKLSEPLVKWAASMFSVFYASELRGASTMYTFVPQVLTNSSGIAAKTRFDSYVGAMATARGTDPDLVDILNFLGFTNESVLSLDFTRDSRGLTLPIVMDEQMMPMFINANLYGLPTSDTDVADLYFDYYGQFNVLSYPDDAQLNGDVIFAHRYLGDAVGKNFNIKYGSNAGTFLNNVFYPHAISLNVVAYAATQDILDRIRDIHKEFQRTGLPMLPYALDQRIIDVVGVAQFDSTTNITFSVIDGANTYVLPDTYEFYEAVKKAELIMNNVDYRAKLQSLSNAIRTRSITKPS